MGKVCERCGKPMSRYEIEESVYSDYLIDEYCDDPDDEEDYAVIVDTAVITYKRYKHLCGECAARAYIEDHS